MNTTDTPSYLFKPDTERPKEPVWLKDSLDCFSMSLGKNWREATDELKNKLNATALRVFSFQPHNCLDFKAQIKIMKPPKNLYAWKEVLSSTGYDGDLVVNDDENSPFAYIYVSER